MTVPSVPQLISNNSELTQIYLQLYEKWPMARDEHGRLQVPLKAISV